MADEFEEFKARAYGRYMPPAQGPSQQPFQPPSSLHTQHKSTRSRNARRSRLKTAATEVVVSSGDRVSEEARKRRHSAMGVADLSQRRNLLPAIRFLPLDEEAVVEEAQPTDIFRRRSEQPMKPVLLLEVTTTPQLHHQQLNIQQHNQQQHNQQQQQHQQHHQQHQHQQHHQQQHQQHQQQSQQHQQQHQQQLQQPQQQPQQHQQQQQQQQQQKQHSFKKTPQQQLQRQKCFEENTDDRVSTNNHTPGWLLEDMHGYTMPADDAENDTRSASKNTNSHFNEVNERSNEVNERSNEVKAHPEDVNVRLNEVNERSNEVKAEVPRRRSCGNIRSHRKDRSQERRYSARDRKQFGNHLEQGSLLEDSHVNKNLKTESSESIKKMRAIKFKDDQLPESSKRNPNQLLVSENAEVKRSIGDDFRKKTFFNYSKLILRYK